MTDKKQDNNIEDIEQTTPTASESEAVSESETTSAPAPVAKGGGKVIAIVSLVIALFAAVGSGYLGYLWDKQKRDDAATLEARVEQAVTTELKSLQGELKVQQDAANELRGESRSYGADIQTLTERSQDYEGGLRTLQGEIQTVKGSIETQKGNYAIQGTTVRTLQKDLRTIQESIQGLQEGIQAMRSGLETQKGELQVRRKEIQALQGETQSLGGNLQSLGDEVSAAGTQREQQIARFNSQLKNLQLGLNDLRRTLEAVRDMAASGGDVNAFALSEVEYLLRLADYKLRLQRDVPAALTALTAAQERLQPVTAKEDHFLGVQKMIAENMAALRGIELPDHSALAYKIAEMGKNINDLPLLQDKELAQRKERLKLKIEEVLDAESQQAWWEQVYTNVTAELKKLVIIHREGGPGPLPLMAEKEEYFLFENLRLKLESMRLALLSHDATNYQDSNALARKWLQTYFNTEDQAVATLLSELEALQTVQFNPYIPDMSSTLKAFLDIMERRSPVRSVVTPPDTESGDRAQVGGARP